MKTKDEMMREYKMYSDKILSSNNPEYMKLLKESCDWMFLQAAINNPELADSVLSHLAEVDWNNYLSEREMVNISKRMINQDGSRGFHWQYEDVKGALEALGGKLEDYPFYNCYAMASVINMIYSDHANSISIDMGHATPKEVPNEEMALSCYRKAVEKLRDMDRPHFARNYFRSTMYDDSPMPK